MGRYGGLCKEILEFCSRGLFCYLVETVNAVDAKKWSNILALVELLFHLPMFNGKVERMFSVLKSIKTEKRTRLIEDNLVMRISVDAPEMSAWDASDAVKTQVECKNTLYCQRYKKNTRITCSSSGRDY